MPNIVFGSEMMGTQKYLTLNNVSSTMVYDSYGRMTGKEKEGATVFTSAQFSGTKPHATTSASAALNVFPTDQTIRYNALDKVVTIGQDGKIAQFTYGYDAQRIRMVVTDTLINRTRTKDYVGNCEFVNDNGSRKVYTYLTGPYGVFAVVVNSGNGNEVNYIYKDHLGSWTTIADSIGNIVERRSFDAWGNLRNPITWSGTPNRPPKFDRGFTGHEHLFAFGLINMNGRMYDPLLSSFLSPDNYMQDPTSQQGFNRYAYCMYNPLKYVDPSGNRYYGYDESYMYRIIDEITQQVLHEWYSVYDVAVASVQMTISMACGLYSHGLDTHGNGSGNHGSPGGSVEVKFKGNGKYEVVKGLYDGGNTVYVVDDEGNRIGILGYTLTPYTFYNEDGVFIKNKTIDLNDYSGRDFWDEFLSDTPSLFTYIFDKDNGGQRGGYYDFKAKNPSKMHDGMLVDFGFGVYIATPRDIGNFVAGYISGINGITYESTRLAFDIYQILDDGHIEPPVSRSAQNMGYNWGFHIFYTYWRNLIFH